MNKLIINAENREQYENTAVDFDGAIEIAANMGCVKFASINAALYICAKAGSGVTAGWSVTAGGSLRAHLPRTA